MCEEYTLCIGYRGRGKIIIFGMGRGRDMICKRSIDPHSHVLASRYHCWSQNIPSSPPPPAQPIAALAGSHLSASWRAAPAWRGTWRRPGGCEWRSPPLPGSAAPAQGPGWTASHQSADALRVGHLRSEHVLKYCCAERYRFLSPGTWPGSNVNNNKFKYGKSLSSPRWNKYKLPSN